MKDGVTTTLNNEWAVLVTKKDKSNRFCVGYRIMECCLGSRQLSDAKSGQIDFKTD